MINALKDFDCIIFHDVDLLAENDRNIHDCKMTTNGTITTWFVALPSRYPTTTRAYMDDFDVTEEAFTVHSSNTVQHMSTYVDTFNYVPQIYTRPDLTLGSFKKLVNFRSMPLYGGVTAMTPRQFQIINGYSNVYWGWGCEDEDLSFRLFNAKFNIQEATADLGRYTMIRHHRDAGNSDNFMRFYQLKDAAARQYHDGLSTIQFSIVSVSEHDVLTHIVLDVGSTSLGKLTEAYFGQPGHTESSLLDDHATDGANTHIEAVKRPISVDDFRGCILSIFMVIVASTIIYAILPCVSMPKRSRDKLPLLKSAAKKPKDNYGHRRGSSLPRNLKLNDLSTGELPSTIDEDDSRETKYPTLYRRIIRKINRIMFSNRRL